LSKLASAVRIDAFARVLKAIDDMVSELVAEKADEIEHRDYCIKGLNDNEITTAKKVHEKGRSEQQVEALTSESKELGDAITGLEGEINTMKESLVQAKVDREAEQELYETSLQEQKDTETLLQNALDALKEAYASPNDAALVQKSAVTQEPAPEGFSEYRQHEGGVGVVMMIEQIITDTQNTQKALKKDNQAAKDGYTAFKEETTKTMETKADEIVDKTAQKSKTDQELVEENEELDGLNTDLEDLSSVKNGLHGECDYILKNFDARQQARDEEVNALRQAKAILKGMKVSE
jgi:chromosome segregation ATPase